MTHSGIPHQGNAMIIGITLAALLLQPFTDDRRDGTIDAAVVLTGVSSAEELDDDIAEKFREYTNHPIRINIDSRSRLLSSGLFSPYQAASLIDYRERNGPVRSTTELSAVEGFPPEYAKALSHFISYDERAYVPGSDRIEASTRDRLYLKDDGEHSHGMKLTASYQDAAALTLVRNRPYDGKGRTGFSFKITSRDRRTALFAGDFHVRYGQGLGTWSGFSLSGLSSIQAFSRNATGISQATSFSGSGCMRGTGIQYGGHHVKASAFVSPGADWKAGGNISVLGKYWEGGFSLSADDGRAIPAADWRICLDGLDLCGELACDITGRCLAGLVSVRKMVSERLEAALAIRAYPESYGASSAGAIRSSTSCKDEKGISSAVCWRVSEAFESTFTADMVQKYSDLGKKQLKMLLTSRWAQPNGNWSANLRAVSRLRNYGDSNRKNVRLEGIFDDGRWRLAPRVEWVGNKGNAFLFSVEEGFRYGCFNVYSRQTAFRIDNWDDRIYVYERDLPGNFSVPACNGTGCRISGTACIRISNRLRFDMKIGKTVRLDDRKKDILEFKVQLSASLSGKSPSISESL